MKLLLKQVIVADTNSPYNGQAKDILIIDGLITEIWDGLEAGDARIIEQEGLHVSPGWVDTFSHFCDPGLEYRETLESGANAAAAGGYTTVFTLPNTLPVVYSKAQVEYVVQRSKSLPVNIIPLGAITKNGEGKELAEMYDMLNSGAVAFSDGLNPVQTSGLFLKALQYAKAFDGVLVQVPIDKSIGQFGLMNEGITSTQLGLPGIPAIAEDLLVARDIELARYAHSKLHITGVSTAKSIELITKAKAEGVQLTCSVTPYHLFFNDKDLSDYNTDLKVDPPVRNNDDVVALRKAVEDGIIDCIASHHIPQNRDNKICEFEYAHPGMIGLESCFGVLNSLFPSLKTEQLFGLLGGNAREIFKLFSATIQQGAKADLTLFERHTVYEFSKKETKSKSSNSAFIGKQLKGKVIGIINKEQLYLN